MVAARAVLKKGIAKRTVGTVSGNSTSSGALGSGGLGGGGPGGLGDTWRRRRKPRPRPRPSARPTRQQHSQAKSARRRRRCFSSAAVCCAALSSEEEVMTTTVAGIMALDGEGGSASERDLGGSTSTASTTTAVCPRAAFRLSWASLKRILLPRARRPRRMHAEARRASRRRRLGAVMATLFKLPCPHAGGHARWRAAALGALSSGQAQAGRIAARRSSAGAPLGGGDRGRTLFTLARQGAGAVPAAPRVGARQPHRR